MNSYKRHVYKTKNPPKPPKEVIPLDWWRSRVWAVAGEVNCIPVDNTFYKNSMDTPLIVGEQVFDNVSLTIPLPDGYYTYSNTEINSNTTGVINYMLVQNSTVVQLSTGNCFQQPDDTYSSIQITKMWKDSSSACADTELLTFYVNDDDIISSDINPPVQLYTDSLGNNEVDPSTDVGLGQTGSPGDVVKYVIDGISGRYATLDSQGRLTTPIGICSI